MFKRELLIDRLRPLQDKEMAQFKNKIDYNLPINYDQFMELFQNRLISQTSNQLKGFDAFPHRHVQTGVDQYIQTLIMLHGIDGLSIFEHDYYWYKMVYPNIKFSTWDTLTPERPVLMAMPFPGYLDEHPYLQCILDICDQRGIDVHLDCAWLPSAFGMEFDFDRPCIKSFAMSLSKCYSLDWARVGMRWSRETQNNDPITYDHGRGLMNQVAVSIGYQYLKQFPIDHLIHKHRDNYMAMCKELWLRPSKIIHAVHSLDRTKLYGCRDVLEDALMRWE